VMKGDNVAMVINGDQGTISRIDVLDSDIPADTGCNAEQAEAALIACERNCKTAIVMVLKNLDAAEAKKRLDQHGGFIRQVLDKE
jgi:N-acetylmuramic acid 6-phosphate (MurNAc-6-P) etherase